MPSDPDPIPRYSRAEYSPLNPFQRESVIAGLGEMGRVTGAHQVRKRVIGGPQPMFAQGPHHSTLLQQARVWSYCV
jgi:hypothetical protein